MQFLTYFFFTVSLKIHNKINNDDIVINWNYLAESMTSLRSKVAGTDELIFEFPPLRRLVVAWGRFNLATLERTPPPLLISQKIFFLRILKMSFFERRRILTERLKIN
jgi:hypothetical protein